MWPALNVSDQLSEYYGYDVEYSEVNGTELRQYKRVTHRLYTIHVTIDSLNHDTVYDIQVTPFRMWKNIREYGTPYPSIRSKTTSLCKCLNGYSKS